MAYGRFQAVLFSAPNLARSARNFLSSEHHEDDSASIWIRIACLLLFAKLSQAQNSQDTPTNAEGNFDEVATLATRAIVGIAVGVMALGCCLRIFLSYKRDHLILRNQEIELLPKSTTPKP